MEGEEGGKGREQNAQRKLFPLMLLHLQCPNLSENLLGKVNNPFQDRENYRNEIST